MSRSTRIVFQHMSIHAQYMPIQTTIHAYTYPQQPGGWVRLTAVLNFSMFSTDLKRIQTPHRLFWGFWAIKTTTHWSGCRVQVWVKFKPLLVICQSLPMANPEDNWRFWLQSPWLSSWGTSSVQLGQVRQDLTGEHKHRLFPSPSQLQSLQASTCSAWGKCATTRLVLTQYSMLCKISASDHNKWYLFSCDMKFSMEFARICCSPKLLPLLCSICGLFIGLWVKIRDRNKTECSKLDHVQSSRSKSATCPRKGLLLRLKLNSTVDFTWLCAKDWKQRLPKFAAKSVANEIQCLKAM